MPKFVASFSALLVTVVAAGAPPPIFKDATEASGLIFRHRNSKTPRKYLPEMMSGGVAILDYNQDGWMDVFFVNGASLDFPQPQGKEPDKSDPRFWNRLFRNDSDGTFTDVTVDTGLQGRGYGMGAAVGDYDNDGFPDLLVTKLGTGDLPAATLYRNEGGRRFVDATEAAGLKTQGWASSAGFFDYDRDGQLDLFIARYMEWRFDVDYRCGMETTYGRTYCHPDLFEPVSNYLFHNNGDGTFSDASNSSGIQAIPGKGLGVAFADFNLDGWIDVAVANDSHPQFLFKNEGDGTFSEVALFAGTAYDEHGKEFAGMGIDFGDLDNDGLPDLVVTALPQEKYAVFYNAGDEAFEYRSGESNVGRASQFYSGWGMSIFDYDNDGRRDLFFANGHVMDNIEQSRPHLRYLQPPLLLRGEGRSFVDHSGRAGEIFKKSWAGRGAAVGDLDNDGDLDIVASNLDGTAYLAQNLSADHGRNHWIGLDLRGCGGNRDAIGAQITLTARDGTKQHASATRAGSYLSSRDRRVFFGLGANSKVRLIEIQWPNGTRQQVEPGEVDRLVRIEEPGDC